MMTKKELIIGIAQNFVKISQYDEIDLSTVDKNLRKSMLKKLGKIQDLNYKWINRLLKRYRVDENKFLHSLGVNTYGVPEILVHKLQKLFKVKFDKCFDCTIFNGVDIYSLSLKEVKFIKKALKELKQHCRLDEEDNPYIKYTRVHFHHSYYHGMPYEEYLIQMDKPVTVDEDVFLYFPKIKVDISQTHVIIYNHGLRLYSWDMRTNKLQDNLKMVNTMEMAYKNPKELVKISHYVFRIEENNTKPKIYNNIKLT